MRDWHKSIADELVAVPVSQSVPNTETTPISPQITWSACTAILVLFILLTVRPFFVEIADREKPLEPRRLNYPLVFVSSAASGLVVLLLSTL